MNLYGLVSTDYHSYICTRIKQLNHKDIMMNKYPTPTYFECYKMFFKYAFNFSARSRRAEYGKVAVINWTIFIAFNYILDYIEDHLYTNSFDSWGLDLWDLRFYFCVILALFLGIISIPSCSLTVRRAHDCGISSYKLFISLIVMPICSYIMGVLYDFDSNIWGMLFIILLVSCILLLSLFFIDSKPEENEWGVSAKYYDDSDAE